jgi:hypothetical protein
MHIFVGSCNKIFAFIYLLNFLIPVSESCLVKIYEVVLEIVNEECIECIEFGN